MGEAPLSCVSFLSRISSRPIFAFPAGISDKVEVEVLRREKSRMACEPPTSSDEERSSEHFEGSSGSWFLTSAE